MIKCCSTFNLLITRIVKMKAGELFAILSVPQIRQGCDCQYYVRNRRRIWKYDWKIWLWKQSNWFKSYQTMLLFTLREKIIQKWKYAEKCRWGSFFIWTDLEKFCIASVAYKWILCSEWVPSEWESKQLIKTYIILNNPQDSSPSIRRLVKWKDAFVINKLIIEMI